MKCIKTRVFNYEVLQRVSSCGSVSWNEKQRDTARHVAQPVYCILFSCECLYAYRFTPHCGIDPDAVH